MPIVFTSEDLELKQFILGVLIAADQAADAVISFGAPDITISARCGMALLDARAGIYSPTGPHGIPQWALTALGNALNDIQRNHCYAAIQGDMDRAIDTVFLLRSYVNLLGDSNAQS